MYWTVRWYGVAMSDEKKLVPVIDRTFELRELPEALRYLESGASHGKVVVTMDA